MVAGVSTLRLRGRQAAATGSQAALDLDGLCSRTLLCPRAWKNKTRASSAFHTPCVTHAITVKAACQCLHAEGLHLNIQQAGCKNFHGRLRLQLPEERNEMSAVWHWLSCELAKQLSGREKWVVCRTTALLLSRSRSSVGGILVKHVGSALAAFHVRRAAVSAF